MGAACVEAQDEFRRCRDRHRLRLPHPLRGNGFRWQNLRAVDTSQPPYDTIHAASGVTAIQAYGGADVAYLGSGDGSEFALRSLKFTDVNADEYGRNITVWGYRDGVQVATDYIFSFGTDHPTKFRFSAEFRHVDSIHFITNDLTFALDDIQVKVPDNVMGL